MNFLTCTFLKDFVFFLGTYFLICYFFHFIGNKNQHTEKVGLEAATDRCSLKIADFLICNIVIIDNVLF